MRNIHLLLVSSTRKDAGSLARACGDGVFFKLPPLQHLSAMKAEVFEARCSHSPNPSIPYTYALPPSSSRLKRFPTLLCPLHQRVLSLMQRTLRLQHVVTTIRRASTRSIPPRTNPTRREPLKVSQAEPAQPPSSRDAPAPLPPSPPPKPKKITPNQLTPSRAIPWAITSLLAGGLGLYLVQLYISATQPCSNPAIASLSAQQDVSARYDETADSFDAEVGLSERLMGINSLRKRLARQCKGHVLEASCGTGRNLGYFDLGPMSAVESLTFVDLSPQMVEVCKRKWDVLVGEEREGLEKARLSGRTTVGKMKRSLVVRFLTGSALESMPPPPAVIKTTTTSTENPSQTPTPVLEKKEKYTTILQTMGLCSTPSPHLLFTSLASHLDVSDPNARILLLEHGRSYAPWLNRILDNSAQRHAEIHGCWFNRDIGGIVEEEARKAGLEVKRVRRKHLGTTWVFEIGVGEELLERSGRQRGLDGGGVRDEGRSEGEGSGWRGWLPWK